MYRRALQQQYYFRPRDTYYTPQGLPLQSIHPQLLIVLARPSRVRLSVSRPLHIALCGSRFGLGVRQEKISLPSAADLFDSVGVGSFMSPSGPAIPATDSPATATPKRRKDGGSIHRSSISSSSAKRNKSNAEGEKSGGVSKGLIPPQMSRPNIVTEDSALWSSDASVKRQRQTAAENKRAGGGAGNGKGVDEKGAKGSMTYKQREKVGRLAGRPGFLFFFFFFWYLFFV